jgi:hypothetical protein
VLAADAFFGSFGLRRLSQKLHVRPRLLTPHNARNAERITFLAQAEKVLAECRKRVAALPC